MARSSGSVRKSKLHERQFVWPITKWNVIRFAAAEYAEALNLDWFVTTWSLVECETAKSNAPDAPSGPARTDRIWGDLRLPQDYIARVWRFASSGCSRRGRRGHWPLQLRPCERVTPAEYPTTAQGRRAPVDSSTAACRKNSKRDRDRSSLAESELRSVMYPSPAALDFAGRWASAREHHSSHRDAAPVSLRTTGLGRLSAYVRRRTG